MSLVNEGIVFLDTATRGGGAGLSLPFLFMITFGVFKTRFKVGHQ